MKAVLFYHSLVSDWNHGNAHFLRGIASDLLARGCNVRIYEPRDCWSRRNLILEQGYEPLRQFREVYPELESIRYSMDDLDLDQALFDADVVIAHEWNDPDLLLLLTEHRAKNPGYRLLFHDTHHRAFSESDRFGRLPLHGFDGVLVYGSVLKDLYLQRKWNERVWVWHEAADTRVFRPQPTQSMEGDVVWIGNWGDEERTTEIEEFLIEPVRKLGLRARVHGVRYPPKAIRTLENAGIEYAGWLPNFRVPEVFGNFRLTVHIPRRPYAASLPGIPTIRPFEAMACGIPMISAPWDDSEQLFREGSDYLIAADGKEMARLMRYLLTSPARRRKLSANGRATILNRHTCTHRVDELFKICRELGIEAANQPTPSLPPKDHSKPTEAGVYA